MKISKNGGVRKIIVILELWVEDDARLQNVKVPGYRLLVKLNYSGHSTKWKQQSTHTTKLKKQINKKRPERVYIQNVEKRYGKNGQKRPMTAEGNRMEKLLKNTTKTYNLVSPRM